MNMALIQGWALGFEAAGRAVCAHTRVGLGSPYTGEDALAREEGEGHLAHREFHTWPSNGTCI